MELFLCLFVVYDIMFLLVEIIQSNVEGSVLNPSVFLKDLQYTML